MEKSISDKGVSQVLILRVLVEHIGGYGKVKNGSFSSISMAHKDILSQFLYIFLTRTHTHN